MRHHDESLWAILPSAIPHVIQLMTGQSSERQAPQPQASETPRRIAVIPVHGVLTKDGPSYYGSNYDTITSALERAAADPAVDRIVLSVDSPGGQVTGLPETAAVVAQVAKVKPVSALVEGTSASAAYWLTSQANDITLTPSGEVGSVGVRMMHVDCSAMLEKAGYKVTELYSGDFKTEWSPFKPVSDEAAADMQSKLEATHKDFIGAVSAGRGNRASASIRKSRFGEGRMFSADAAKAHGLVDSVQSARDFYRGLVTGRTSAPVGLNPRRARLELERSRLV
jgi:signal peptide peptidase SppA